MNVESLTKSTGTSLCAVDTDHAGHVVVRGAPLNGAGADAGPALLLRGSLMRAFDLGALAAFFEAVQAAAE
jgi:hypothetical protein